MSNKTTEFVIRMYAEQIAEGTFFSMVDLNDSTLNRRGNIESYFSDVFFDTIQDTFGIPEGSEMDGQTFAEHMADVMFGLIDLDKFVQVVQDRVNELLVEQSRKYVELRMKEIEEFEDPDGSLKPVKPKSSAWTAED